MYQESGFLGTFFGTVYCRIAGASPPGPHQGSALDPLGAYSVCARDVVVIFENEAAAMLEK